MKTDTHPEYRVVTVHCSCGNEFQTRSTADEVRVELCSECHPFYTGKQKLVDTGGRIDRFERRYGRRKKGGSADAAPADEAPADKAPATEAPADKAPATQAPAEEKPVAEAPATEAPVDKAPATEAPADTAPVADVPADTAPADAAPTEKTPAADGSDDAGTTDVADATADDS